MITLLKLAIDEIRDLLLDESSRDREIDEAVRNAEREFEIGRQKYPGDEYVLVAESEFAKLLQDHERCLDALKRAHQSNPRDPFIASRLASILLSRGEKDKARGYLEEALASNGGDKRLNFQYTELLRTEAGEPPDSLSYYYRRAFSKWDENYESQFWYARFTFESSDPAKVSEAKEVFRHLRNAPMSHRDRIRMRDTMGGLSSPTQFSGTVNRIEAAHGFVTVDGREDSVFFHENDMTDDTWKRLSTRARVVFMIGFTLRGPRASNLRLESSTT